MKKKASNIVLGLLILGIGISIGKLTNWGYFEITKELSIIDALNFLVTIGVAIYIVKVLEKDIQNDRIEKDLYIAKVYEFESQLIIIENLVYESSISYSKVNTRIHFCGITRNSIFSNLKEIKKISPSQISDLEQNISKNIRTLKKLLTGTPIDKKETSKIKIDKGIVSYSQDRILEVVSETNSLKNNLFKLKIVINLM